MDSPVGFNLAVCMFLAVSVLFPPAGASAGLYEANLLANPGFEDYYTGSNPNWSSGSSVQYDLQTNNSLSRGVQAWLNAGADICSIRSDGPGTGHTGDYYGTGGNSGSTLGVISRMRQDIDLAACGYTSQELDDGSLWMDAGAWLSSVSTDFDTVAIRVEFLDAAAQTLTVPYTSGARNPDSWTLYQSGPLALTPGTRFIRFDVEFVKYAGENSDGRIDDAWVRLRPAVNPSQPMLDRNLVCNPGFEAGTRGWRTLAGNPRARVGNIDGVVTHSGQILLFGGQRPLAGSSNQAIATQEFTLANYGFSPAVLEQTDGLLFLRFDCWLYSYGSVGQAKMKLEVCDEAGFALVQYDSGRVRSSSLPAPFHRQIALPPAARSLKLTYDTIDPGGTNLDGYLDDVSLVITRQPHRPARTGPFTVGHRGNSVIAPENTLASLRATAHAGQYAELDTYVCATGELVVMHDSTVDRTTDGTGSISTLSLATLKTLDAGSWFSADFTGEPVPTLEEVLGALLPGVTPLIERKGGTAATYVSELHRLGVQNQVVLQAFDWTFLSQVHQLDPTISLGALLDGTLTTAKVAQAQEAGVWFVAQSQGYVTPEALALAHSAGLSLVVWTVNSATAVDNFIALGVDGIITDNPAMVTWIVNPSLCPADFDADGDVDDLDFRLFTQCWTGPALAWSMSECQLADLDSDTDIDQSDFGLFQRCLTGEQGTPVLGCAVP